MNVLYEQSALPFLKPHVTQLVDILRVQYASTCRLYIQQLYVHVQTVFYYKLNYIYLLLLYCNRWQIVRNKHQQTPFPFIFYFQMAC